jgi:hypothetical protein
VTRRWKTPSVPRRLRRRVGFRGYFLATLAIVDVFQGLNFIHPGSTGQALSNTYLADAIPFRNIEMSNWTWAFAWWLTAAFCLYNAFKRCKDHWGFIAAITIKVAYVVSLVYATMHDMPDGPRRIAIWAWITTAVWVMSRLPEPPYDLIDLNEQYEQERTGEIPTHGEGGDGA